MSYLGIRNISLICVSVTSMLKICSATVLDNIMYCCYKNSKTIIIFLLISNRFPCQKCNCVKDFETFFSWLHLVNFAYHGFTSADTISSVGLVLLEGRVFLPYLYTFTMVQHYSKITSLRIFAIFLRICFKKYVLPTTIL